MRKRFMLSSPFLSLLTALVMFGLTGGVAAAAHSTVATTNVDQRIHNAHPNTNPVACNGRTDFFGIYSDYNGTVTEYCYANRGQIYPNVFDVTFVCSGNNSGTFDYYDYNTGKTTTIGFYPSECFSFNFVYIGNLVIS